MTSKLLTEMAKAGPDARVWRGRRSTGRYYLTWRQGCVNPKTVYRLERAGLLMPDLTTPDASYMLPPK